MEDADNAPAQRQRAGYFQQYLARMAPTPLPPPPLPFPSTTSKPTILSRVSNGRKSDRSHANTNKAAKEKACKSLVDAFKQHGMKLCDGSKLNAVAKGVTFIGVIPPTLGVHITALYLSQNELRGLDGIGQFKGVRLLSLAANMLTRFSDVEQLQQLQQLRHLNLMGNPLCGQPNYRFRVVDTLSQLHILDTVEISKHERELAPLVGSQDRALREMVMKNHVDIQKLQRLAVWIKVLGEFSRLVLRDAVTGRFDQLPSPQNGVDIESFLRIWRFEDALSGRERDALETQMLAIIARTKAKMLEETPQTKATEMLLKLANGPSSAVVRRWNGKGKGMPDEMQRECHAWESAYVHVLQLQQQTIANLRGECDRHRREEIEKQRQLIVVNPHKRRVGEAHDSVAHHQHRTDPVRSRVDQRQMREEPEGVNHVVRVVTAQPAISQSDAESSVACGGSQTKGVTDDARAKVAPANRRRVIRSGEFGNKTLHEAIHSFTLRAPQAPSRVPPSTRQALRPQTTTSYHSHASQAVAETDTQVSTRSAQEQTLAKRRVLRRMSLSNGEHYSDVESCGRTATETVFSGDASSVRGCSIDGDVRYDPVLTVSSAQHHGQRDLVRQHWIHQTQELYTVLENEENQKSTHRFEDQDDNENELSHHDDNSALAPRFLSDRQYELEAREEKYITALMESEQRELDLRHQISAMHHQLAGFQRLVSENESERRKIKEEITARALCVARPTLLRRFFAKWGRYCQWAMQLRDVERKRRFVTQHDAFWNWRRKVWIHQELRRIHRRQSLRVVRCHLIEWANLTRISVIAVHTQALRQSHLLQRIVNEWRQYAFVQRHMNAMAADHENAVARELVATSFGEWVQETRKRKQMQRLHQFYSREGRVHEKRLVLSKWKIYVLSIARPQREKAAAWTLKRQAIRRKQYFTAWKRLAKCQALYRACMRQRVWSLWRGCFQRRRRKRELAMSCRLETLRVHFSAWQSVGADRLVTRRALSLASRHVNHRRLRKLWMHWKVYSIARKRHMQGASKAFKHYFIKLLRKTWAKWKQETRANAVSVKLTKQRELQFHFNSFCRGVQCSRQEKKRLVFVSHALRRRQLALRRRVFTGWAACARNRRRCKALYSMVSSQRSNALMAFVWSQWKHGRLLKLKRALLQSTHQYKSINIEKQEAEEELVQVNDRSVSLQEQVRQLKLQLDVQTKDVREYQDELLLRERAMVALETQLEECNHQLEQSKEKQRQWAASEDGERKQLSESATALREENKTLQSKARELETECEGIKRSLRLRSDEIESMEVRLASLASENDQLRQAMEVQERSLSGTIQDLTQRLGDEQRERDDTVRRLQEYEARIASTCAEIGDHEKVHEEERIALRTETVRLENLHKEESVRNEELQRLLHEKNDQIIALSVRLKDSESRWKKSESERGPSRAQAPVISEAAPGSRTCSAHEDSPFEAAAQTTQSHYESANRSNPEPIQVQLQVFHQTAEPSCPSEMASAPAPGKMEPSEEELQIDARTSRIHADIQLLQERISKRLQQIPCAPAIDEISTRGQYAGKMVLFESDSGSISTISESEHDERAQRKLRRSGSGAQPTAVTTRRSVTKSSASKASKKAGARLSDRESDRENVSRAANLSKQTTASTTSQGASLKRSLVRSVATTESLKTKKRVVGMPRAV